MSRKRFIEMISMKKLISVVLSLALFLTLFSTNVFASTNEQISTDDMKTEVVNIDGVDYIYRYNFEGAKRIVTVTDTQTDHVDTIIYNVPLKSLKINENEYSTNRDYGWVTIAEDSHTITWGEATTAAAVAAAIAAGLGFLGPAGVIAAMGTAALGAIAANCTKAILHTEIQMLNLQPYGIQYMYIWTLTVPTGEVYGPFYYLDA